MSFVDFLCDHCAEESLEFWISVELYRLMPNSHERICASRKIFDKFVLEGAPREINIASDQRDRVIQKMDSFQVDASLFDEIQQSVYLLLENDCYRRFKTKGSAQSPTVARRRKLPELDAEIIQYFDSLQTEKPKQQKGVFLKKVNQFFHLRKQDSRRSSLRLTPSDYDQDAPNSSNSNDSSGPSVIPRASNEPNGRVPLTRERSVSSPTQFSEFLSESVSELPQIAEEEETGPDGAEAFKLPSHFQHLHHTDNQHHASFLAIHRSEKSLCREPLYQTGPCVPAQ